MDGKAILTPSQSLTKLDSIAESGAIAPTLLVSHLIPPQNFIKHPGNLEVSRWFQSLSCSVAATLTSNLAMHFNFA
jgi:hypothetical protein